MTAHSALLAVSQVAESRAVIFILASYL
jgi:hypothetical protein